MECNLVKEVKKVNDKTFVNFYLVFEGIDSKIPVQVKLLPMPKALEKNASAEQVKEYEKEKNFREYVNTKVRTQFETLATSIKE